MDRLNGLTVAFDLDGTLVDSAPDLIGTLNRLLVARGLPPAPLSSARHLVGRGARALLHHGFQEAGAVWDEAAEPELFDRFIDDYRTHIADGTTIFPGVIEALETLAGRGARLCVATNKRTDLALELMRALDLTGPFGAICGADSVSARKPDGAHVREAVARAGGDPARAVMVGDSIFDVAAARNAPCPVIVVGFGYTEAPPHELGGDVVIDDYAALIPAVERLLSSQTTG